MTGAAILGRPEVSEGDVGGKRRQILDGARRVFLDSGFDAASMSEIARTAGVSKGTLYVYFDSKEALFEALVRHDKRAQVEQLCWPQVVCDDLRLTLIDMGCRLLVEMLEPDRLAQLRTVIAVSAKFPQIGRAFFESGPEYGRTILAAFLEEHAAANGLSISNFDLAAEHLVELCKAHILLRAILNVGERPAVSVLKAHVTASVDTFLRAYRAA